MLMQARALHQLMGRTSWFRTCLCRLLTTLQACFRSACSSCSMTTLGMPICTQHGHQIAAYFSPRTVPLSHLHPPPADSLWIRQGHNHAQCASVQLHWGGFTARTLHNPLAMAAALQSIMQATKAHCLASAGTCCAQLHTEVFFLGLYSLALLAGCRW